MDACLWLLEGGVRPDEITWIRPRDSWCLNRRNIQPGDEFFESSIGGFVQQMEAAAHAESVGDLFARLEANKQLLRIDPTVQPTMYRCATVTESELEALASIRNVVRLGRVERIDLESITLAQGTMATSAAALHIDCTADGLERRPVVPVFDDQTITLQPVRTCQQVFSAAFLAHLECRLRRRGGQERTRNGRASSEHRYRLDAGDAGQRAEFGPGGRQDEDLTAWLQASRLDAFSELRTLASGTDPVADGLMQRMNDAAIPAVVNLQNFLADADSPPT